MQNDSFLINIDLTPEYQRNLNHLAKNTEIFVLILNLSLQNCKKEIY